MFAGTKAHSVEILLTGMGSVVVRIPWVSNLRHSIQDTLARAFAILLASLSVRIDYLVYKLAHCLLEGFVAL